MKLTPQKLERWGYRMVQIVSQAAHCCNDDQQSQWENGEFDPCRSETPENFII